MSPPWSVLAMAAVPFAAGVASIASPCVLPLVPAYLAAVRLAGGGRRRPSRRQPVLFVAGFTAVVVSLGVFTGAVASIVPAPAQLRFAGVVLFAMGLGSLGLLPGLGLGAVVGAAAGRPLTSLALGGLFGLMTAPCATAALGVALAAAATGGTALRGGFALACYAAGMAAGIAAVGAGAGRTARLLRHRRGAQRAMRTCAGMAAVALGLMLALGQGWRLDAETARVIDVIGSSR